MDETEGEAEAAAAPAPAPAPEPAPAPAQPPAPEPAPPPAAEEAPPPAEGTKTSAVSVKKSGSRLSRGGSRALSGIGSKGSYFGSESSMSLAVRGQSDLDRFKGPRYMNTYRLESQNPFKAETMTYILKEVFDRELHEEMVYDPLNTPKLATSIAALIRSRIKLLSLDRYKYMVFVQVGEKKMHGFDSGMKFLWDPEKDDFMTHYFENRTMFVLAICFGVYWD